MSIITKIVGVTYGDCQRNIKLLGNPGINELDLKREPLNPADSNAVSIGFGKYKLGYLPRPVAQRLAPYMDVGHRYRAEYVSLNQSPFHETVGLTVKIIEI